MTPTYEPRHMPRLMDFGGDISKRWYIDYYLWDATREDFVKRRYWGMNKYTTVTARRQVSKKKMEEIRSFMEAIREPEPEHRFNLQTLTLRQAVVYFMNYKNAATLGNEEHVFEKNYNQGLARVSKNTFRSYADLMYHVFEWLESRKKSNLLVKDFTPKLCNDFFVYLKEGRKIENKTFNKLRGYFSTVFNFYIKHQELSIKNPVHKVEHLRNEESDMHMPFTNGQMQLIKAAMIEKGDYQLLLFVSFIYYTFTRPGEEVRLLRVGDVLEKTIFIPSKRSKNNQGEHIAIPPGLERMIKEHRIREYPKEYFVFSHLGTPGPEQVSKDFFYQRHRKILQGLGLTGYTLYGYKHTGAINLYESTKDILTVQRHCRHYSSSQTDAYLRKYGVIVNMKVVSMPDFGGQALG